MSLTKLAAQISLFSFINSFANAKQTTDTKDWFRDNKGVLHLKLDSDQTYRIVQFTDLHLGEDEARDESTFKMMKDVIRKEEPDFVAITGDLVSGQMID